MLKPTPEDPKHQKDAEQRDRAIAADVKKDPIRILQRPRQNKTKRNKPRENKTEEQPKSVGQARINIAAISAAAFRRNVADKENKVFATSLYKIDKMLEQKTVDTKGG